VKEPGDQGDIYNSYLDVEEIDVADMKQGDVALTVMAS
jgi:isocitrate lyase